MSSLSTISRVETVLSLRKDSCGDPVGQIGSRMEELDMSEVNYSRMLRQIAGMNQQLNKVSKSVLNMFCEKYNSRYQHLDSSLSQLKSSW